MSFSAKPYSRPLAASHASTVTRPLPTSRVSTGHRIPPSRGAETLRTIPGSDQRRSDKEVLNTKPIAGGGKGQKSSDDPILFQDFFKSVGPRTYAAQLKQAKNGNHYLILTEGKRDSKTNELRKHSLYLFSEDFPEFFRLVKHTAEFIKTNPVAPAVRERQKKHWDRQRTAKPSPETAAA